MIIEVHLRIVVIVFGQHAVGKVAHSNILNIEIKKETTSIVYLHH